VKEKAWLNKAVMLKWIAHVWRPAKETKGFCRSYHLYDDFGVHVTAKVEEAFKECNTNTEILP
jgi:hypothetical protein